MSEQTAPVVTGADIINQWRERLCSGKERKIIRSLSQCPITKGARTGFCAMGLLADVMVQCGIAEWVFHNGDRKPGIRRKGNLESVGSSVQVPWRLLKDVGLDVTAQDRIIKANDDGRLTFKQIDSLIDLLIEQGNIELRSEPIEGASCE